MEWRIIPGFGRYEVSEDGLIRRAADSRGGHLKAGRPIRLRSARRDGYLFTGLYESSTGRRRTVLVHRAVALAFLGEPLEDQQVNHLDGVKTHNHYSNLEWCTAKRNRRHAGDLGLNADGLRNGAFTHPERRPHGSGNGNAKLTEPQVVRMRSLFAQHRVSFRHLGATFGVSGVTASDVVFRRTWRHI